MNRRRLILVSVLLLSALISTGCMSSGAGPDEPATHERDRHASAGRTVDCGGDIWCEMVVGRYGSKSDDNH